MPPVLSFHVFLLFRRVFPLLLFTALIRTHMFLCSLDGNDDNLGWHSPLLPLDVILVADVGSEDASEPEDDDEPKESARVRGAGVVGGGG